MLGVAGYSGEFLPLRSLSDLGVRSEASEKSSPLFRHFEAHSDDYVMKYSSGTNIRESPVGVKRWDALNKNGGTMGRFSTATRPLGWGKYDSKDGGARAKQEDRAERNAEGSCRVESA